MRYTIFTALIVSLFFANGLSMASCRQADIASSKGWNVALIRTNAVTSESKSFSFRALRKGEYSRVSDVIALSTQESLTLDKRLGKATVNKDCSVHFEFLERQERTSPNSSKPDILIVDGVLSNKARKVLGTYTISSGGNILEMGALIAMKN